MQNQELSFSPIVAADAEALVLLRIEAMRESLERIGRFDPVRSRERFLNGFDPAATRHILLGEERVGFVVVKPQTDHLLLNHLYVLPAFQGCGIGAVALREICADAALRRLPIRVGALRESASNRFYLQHGFLKVAEAEFDIYYLRDWQLPIA